jgi:hypothetical protein
MARRWLVGNALLGLWLLRLGRCGGVLWLVLGRRWGGVF